MTRAHDFSDFSIMDKTVALAKENGVLVGAHPSLPDRQGFGRREMVISPVCAPLSTAVDLSELCIQEELVSCFVYQVGALTGFLKRHNLSLNHVCIRFALTLIPVAHIGVL